MFLLNFLLIEPCSAGRRVDLAFLERLRFLECRFVGLCYVRDELVLVV